MEAVIQQIVDYIKLHKSLNTNTDFLSDYETGCKEGSMDVLKDIENILQEAGINVTD